MSVVFEVWLDEERQIIRQRLHREPDLPQYQALLAESDACARRLRCPTDVRILVDGEWCGRMPKPVRSIAADSLRRPELKRLAVVTKNAVARVFIRFMRVACDDEKMRAFVDEAAAMAWLTS
jgi:hypothetical protein